jgi:hypothetical protein
MTPLNNDWKYRETIIRLCNELHEDHIALVVDKPIEHAVEQYEFPTYPICTYSSFVNETAKYIQHLNTHGKFVKQNLTDTQAKSEAFAILNEYQGLHGNGLDAAWIDASLQYKGDIESVLLQLKEIIKQQQRKQYVQWKVSHELTCLDWQNKCQMVKVLITDLNEYLPAIIIDCKPEQLVDQIPSLIQMQLNSSAQIQKIIQK